MGYYGYCGISYVYEGNTVKITYLDKDEKPIETQGGYAVILRSFNEKGQAVDDDYYDDDDFDSFDDYNIKKEKRKKGDTFEMDFIDLD